MPTPTGLTRREIYIDARDMQSDSDSDKLLTEEEYIALLTGRGVEKLAENQLVQSFEAEIRVLNPTYTYGGDFQLGDTITVIDNRLEIMIDAVVEGVQRGVDQNGEVLLLTLGYSMPTLHDILKRKVER